MQRLFDIVLSFLAIIVLIPFVLPVMVVLRFSGEGEIFYSQSRIGKGGKTFGLLKFATMLKNSPTIGAGEITVKDDPRILPIGKFLRKTKINELPQLINILKGDISIVGPRPMVPSTWQVYPVQAQVELAKVKPGLTGIGSIYFRDEERYLIDIVDPRAFYNTVIIPYKASLEQWYLRNKSIKLYFVVIFLTTVVVLSPESDLPGKILKGIPEPPEALRH